MLETLDAAAVRRWCDGGLEALRAHQREIDDLNVYPVPDGDTGTNLVLTLTAAHEALGSSGGRGRGPGADDGERERSGDDGVAGLMRRMARGALLGARGNSGVIVSQILRGMADTFAGGVAVRGSELARALRVATDAAYAAVARPVEGTVLSVVAAAAEAAGRIRSDDLVIVARTAARAATEALARTPQQLPVLAHAGVVDAGGRGLCLLLDALVKAVDTGDDGSAHAVDTGDVPTDAVDPSGGVSADAVDTGDVPADAVDPGGGVSAQAVGTGDLSADAVDPGGVSADAVGTGGAPAQALGIAAVPVDGDSAHSAQVVEAGGETLGSPRGIGPASAGDVVGGHSASGRALERTTADGFGAAGGAVGHGEGAAGDAGCSGYGYEVQYLLDATEDAVERLRVTLDRLGDSLVVVGTGDGDPPTWNVHVHVTEIGPAIEAGIEAGRPYRINVTPLQERRTGSDQRGAVVVAAGDGLTALFEAEGAVVVDRNPSIAEMLAAVHETGARSVVLLPNDANTHAVAVSAAREAETTGVRVSVVPTRSPVQALAALAVRDVQRPFAEDVIAMAEAAGACRYGEVCTAQRDAFTVAGQCRAGDLLGLVDGEVHVIGRDVAEVSRRLLDRMLGGGGELVTLVLGADAPPGFEDVLKGHVHRAWPFSEVQCYAGGQPRYHLLAGVE
ncbi:DAK2 domain-containing protein [Actinoplanes xinjiangensis]|uniref:DAK2 domain-containing protein n=1 Tax=Actinoplanes xinjiangensis TaxID=512350 RepID=UPI0034294826